MAEHEHLATPKALILTGFGINCEEEMAAAYRLAGATPTIVHLNEVLHGRVSIHDFDILNFPGGFSFGDDLGSGVVLANKLRYRQTGADGRTLLSDIREFVAAGKFVLGICNGFQVLVKLGLLPNLGGDFQPEVTLTHNASGRYENRWVRLKVNPQAKTPFLKGLTTFEVPVRHGEGRLVVPDAATRERIRALGLNCLTYAGHDDLETGTYPFNPNGADLNCAGLTDTTGHIFGLMPHPEAYLAGCNHPDWGQWKRRGKVSDEGEGLAIFRNIVRHLQLHLPAPYPAGAGGPDVLFAAEEGRAHYERRQQREEGSATATADNVFTAAGGKWDALKQHGRQMRKEPTPAENELWQAVRGQKLGVAFRRQHAIAGYIADFVSLPAKLIIELDGGVHTEPAQAEYDQGRTEALAELGYQVVRFTNEQILTQLPSVLQSIASHLSK
ncbi:DUF559 domain-containing protein [Hymenobacter sp. HMF4947]|uniref:DUF559 domain-containing protein n=1 Tax=Hymenobacter ginkgonis TaxID=2682976 RepID=A0A7K1TD57_9BACT|nr:phosphoribosylformylglycinamidine synthase subunit PurQ [Hymenobacter ginkgonis]MVN76330.1 DUF559 domain-containing protein [Hymenobacter ginkgonis]